MKATRILAAALLAIVPVVSFADAGHSLTRAAVRADLVRLEQAGYNPARSEPRYPDDIAAALQIARSDQNSPSKSQGDNTADATSPDRHRDATHARTA
ncbi:MULTISPECIES: DUF4148 domain-containing protein [Burkholderia cepacia complex]|uniref:DUF4148 domain-containing protein n=1 Tax=Burkholderia cepacia complex TaxID=87882 RepID=UPI00064C301D|nr:MULTISPECIES: DUF4148 domain-containing protein [Burkholderia cepacia complex]AKM04726.1 hypothetical protein ABD05_31165 [Burkholderia pyrrocinia]